MINTEFNCVIARNLNEAWRDAMWLCIQKGYDFVVKGGSYVGQIRRQLENVMIVIDNPGEKPFNFFTPPPFPQPTNEEKIIKYFENYIIGEEIKENEDYTYGSFIAPQIDRIIELLRNSRGNTNQAVICIGNEEVVYLNDPPCLRTIDFKVVSGFLNETVYFRSWDLFTGLPENLGGLQMLKEYVLANLPEFGWKDGKLIAYSSGLHIYEQYFDLANKLNVDKITVDENVMTDKRDFEKEL